jgi:hypothetical protein
MISLVASNRGGCRGSITLESEHYPRDADIQFTWQVFLRIAEVHPSPYCLGFGFKEVHPREGTRGDHNR